MANPETVTTTSESETFALGKKVASGLHPGTFVLLHGDLGAGKTAFVRGMAAGLGANPDDVSSPTFVLIQHYKGRVPLVHVDLYRLEVPRRSMIWDWKRWRAGQSSRSSGRNACRGCWKTA